MNLSFTAELYEAVLEDLVDHVRSNCRSSTKDCYTRNQRRIARINLDDEKRTGIAHLLPELLPLLIKFALNTASTTATLADI